MQQAANKCKFIHSFISDHRGPYRQKRKQTQTDRNITLEKAVYCKLIDCRLTG